MTEKEKAKAYDEALEKAKQIIVEYDYDEHNNVFMEIFPELKESEDKKIRKVIIGLLKQSTYEDCDYDGVNMKDIYAWIEKQGEPIDINPSEFDLRLNKLLKQFETLPKEELVSSLGFYLNVVQNDGTYKPDEKQGGKNDSDVKDYNSIDPHFAKPIDVVEPKFHEGDFIKHNKANIICKVISVNSSSYYVENIGISGSKIELFNAEQNFHLWTIDDAKDGDVLVDRFSKDNVIILYKGINPKLSVLAYCGWNGYNLSIKTNGLGYGGLDNTNYLPATKEQCDLFFSKMKEAGYTFDFEKKELKRIEQNMELTDFESALFTAFSDAWQQYLIGEEVNVAQWAKEHSAELLEEARKEHIEWSEEDEKMIGRIRNIIEAYAFSQSAVDVNGDLCEKKFIDADNWLKSLKNKVQPQPKQEWSEEDEEYINDLIGVFDGQQYQAHSDEEVVKWLKSIRLPYNKEWNENDEEMLKSIIATCELACEDRDSSPARHLLQMQTDWLKSLRPQNTWKPSDVQMQALKEACDIYWEPDGSDALYTLYEQLKKLTE